MGLGKVRLELNPEDKNIALPANELRLYSADVDQLICMSYQRLHCVFLLCCMECRRGLTIRFLSVRPSVCPSVKRVHCDKTDEKSVQIFIPCDR